MVRRWVFAALIMIPLVIAVVVLALPFSLPGKTAPDGSFTWSTKCSAPLTQLLDSPQSDDDDPMADDHPAGAHFTITNVQPGCKNTSRGRAEVAGLLLVVATLTLVVAIAARLRADARVKATARAGRERSPQVNA